MAATLDQIVSATRLTVAETRATADLKQLERLAAQHTPRGFRRGLLAAEIAVIAELKKASPSRGLIRENFHPAELARELQSAGAAALSVLTDEPFFQGSLENLLAASANTSLPCLRKDFMVDEFQMLQARACKADAILLIVAALSDTELIQLSACARSFGLDVLCEAHDELELKRAIDTGFDLIGINARDLRTFKVDLQTTYNLAEKIPPHVVRVAESGIHDAKDIANLRAAGYQAFLVGEMLMKQAFPGEALRALLASARLPHLDLAQNFSASDQAAE